MLFMNKATQQSLNFENRTRIYRLITENVSRIEDVHDAGDAAFSLVPIRNVVCFHVRFIR